MSDINPDRHVFGENPGSDPNPHDATASYHAAKNVIMAEEKVALADLNKRHQAERAALSATFTDRYRQAAVSAGFRKEGE